MQIGEGLYRVGSEIVNSYLIAGQDGVTIIDAGLPGYWKPLKAELAAIGKCRVLRAAHDDGVLAVLQSRLGDAVLAEA